MQNNLFKSILEYQLQVSEKCEINPNMFMNSLKKHNQLSDYQSKIN